MPSGVMPWVLSLASSGKAGQVRCGLSGIVDVALMEEKMRGILVATHGGASADGAVRVANDLGKKLGTTLSAFCVVEPLPLIDPGFGAPYVETPELEEARRHAMRAGVAAQLERCGVTAPIRTTMGFGAAEIAAAARRAGAELIVLGIGPHRLLDRALGHETALQLVQSASTPVLAVAAGAVAAPGHVLVAMDFSPTSLVSARLIARWMRAGDTFHVVHVAHFRDNPVHAELDRARATAALARELDAIVADLALRDGVIVRTTVVVGEPAQMVLELAVREGADLVATGSHGYGIWKRLTLGSVASKILRLSAQSVLVTPIGSLGAPPLTAPNVASVSRPVSREDARVGTVV